MTETKISSTSSKKQECSGSSTTKARLYSLITRLSGPTRRKKPSESRGSRGTQSLLGTICLSNSLHNLRNLSGLISSHSITKLQSRSLLLMSIIGTSWLTLSILKPSLFMILCGSNSSGITSKITIFAWSAR